MTIALLGSSIAATQSHPIENRNKATGVRGFRNRATHNLWTLLEEIKWIEKNLVAGTYREAYKEHLDNTIYRPLIEYLVNGLSK